jgi:mRNA interferase HigB
MKILGSEKMDDFCRKYHDAIPALNRWTSIVKKAEWKNFSDLKRDFATADNVGNDHYVFNIKGNKYRLIVVVVFYAGKAGIRFVGTHKEYDKIGPDKIKML